MNEYETDPQRPPVDSDAQRPPVDPDAQRPQVDSDGGHSNRTTEAASGPLAQGPSVTPGQREPAGSTYPFPGAHGSEPTVPGESGVPAYNASGMPAPSGSGVPASAYQQSGPPLPQPGQSVPPPSPAGTPAPFGQPVSSAAPAQPGGYQPGRYPQPVPFGQAGPQPGAYSPGPSGQPVSGTGPFGSPDHPGHGGFGPEHPGHGGFGPDHPGRGGFGPEHPGHASYGPYPPAMSGPYAGPTGPMPPWGQPVPAARPGRAGRILAVGAAALALMLGSGVAGGFAALAIDGGGNGRTYTAAPIINSADLPAIAERVMDSVVSISTGDGEGSGVVLTADGYVLTNNHVVASASSDTVKVVFADGKTASARIIGTDPKTDLAVVQARNVSGLRPATLGDSDAMRVGDAVLALGSPLGLQGSVTFGIISARDRTIRAGSGTPGEPRQEGAASISGLLQTDAPINPGNSGGALINTRGEVIGINTAIATAGQGSGNIGVGFAIPSNKAKDVAGKLQRGEKVSHPSLGVSVSPAEDGGALVGSVKPDSPAARAGLQQGDVITHFGDKMISDSNDLVAAVQAGKVGDRVELTYTRNGAKKVATVTLAEAS